MLLNWRTRMLSARSPSQINPDMSRFATLSNTRGEATFCSAGLSADSPPRSEGAVLGLPLSSTTCPSHAAKTSTEVDLRMEAIRRSIASSSRRGSWCVSATLLPAACSASFSTYSTGLWPHLCLLKTQFGAIEGRRKQHAPRRSTRPDVHSDGVDRQLLERQ